MSRHDENYVILHGWRWVEENGGRWQEYSDCLNEGIDGFSVYRRTHTPDGPGDCDIDHDQEFSEHKMAAKFARWLAAQYRIHWYDETPVECGYTQGDVLMINTLIHELEGDAA